MEYNFTRLHASDSADFLHAPSARATRTSPCRRLVMALALTACGCTTVTPVGPPPATPYGTPTPAQPHGAPNPPANVNLQGFPLEYRQGYADGCASVSGTERKDAARFKSDGQYRDGWVDGNALCKKR
jgi:hypothetical protein